MDPKGIETRSSYEDTNSLEFRERSIMRLQAELGERLKKLKAILQTQDFNELTNFILQSAYFINHIVLNVDTQESISSTPDTAIVHDLGITIWLRPKDIGTIEFGVLSDLSETLEQGKIDLKRFAEGIYFLEVLTHKFKDGNGRVARSLKLLIDKGNEDSEILESDTKNVLGIGAEAITKTGENTFKINSNPDFERLVLGVAYFAMYKGLSEEEVSGNLKLNKLMPEKGLEQLALKLGIAPEQLKEEFIHFMAVDSDLKWCNFSI
jgi:hypothetical protein